MSVLQNDRYMPICIHPENFDFTRIKGRTDKSFMSHFFNDIFDPLEYGMRLYLVNDKFIKPRSRPYTDRKSVV